MAADISFTVEAIDKASSQIRTIDAGLQAFRNSLALVGNAVRTVDRALDATVGEFVKYADQVRTLTQLTNETAQEMSKLAQVADDYGVTVDDLTTASRKLSEGGLSLNIETLAKLSDEYIKLNTGSERQQFLMDNLGRSGLAFTGILTAGSEAIRARTSAISAMLILDEEAIANARTYEMSLDDLEDSVMGLKIAVGQELLPVLISLINQVNVGVVAWQNMDTQFITFILNVERAMPWITGATRGLEALAAAMLGGARISSGLGAVTASTTGGGRGTMTPPALTVRTTGTGGASAIPQASGGFPSSRYAIVGDRPGGDFMTPYTELVDFNTKRVYNNRDTRRMLGVGRYASGGPVGFSEPGDVFMPAPGGTGGVFSRWETLGYGNQRQDIVLPGGAFSTGVPTLTSATGGGSGGALPSSPSSSVASSVTQAVTAAAMSVSTVSAAAETISDSGKKTEQATREGTSVSARGDEALLRELQGLRKDIKTILPKAIKDGYQSVVGV